MTITNGGFETGSLDPWYTGMYTTSTVLVTSATQHSGTYSCLLDVSVKGNEADIIQDNCINEGTLTIWHLSNDSTYSHVWVLLATPTYDDIIQIGNLTGGGASTWVYDTYTIPDTIASTHTTLILSCTNAIESGTEKWYLDDIVISSGSPTSSFTVSASTTAINNPIIFTDTSNFSPTRWRWYFGDGSAVVTTQNATHTYTTSGTFNAYLVAGIGEAADYTSDIQQITVINYSPINLIGIVEFQGLSQINFEGVNDIIGWNPKNHSIIFWGVSGCSHGIPTQFRCVIR